MNVKHTWMVSTMASTAASTPVIIQDNHSSCAACVRRQQSSCLALRYVGLKEERDPTVFRWPREALWALMSVGSARICAEVRFWVSRAACRADHGV